MRSRAGGISVDRRSTISCYLQNHESWDSVSFSGLFVQCREWGMTSGRGAKVCVRCEGHLKRGNGRNVSGEHRRSNFEKLCQSANTRSFQADRCRHLRTGYAASNLPSYFYRSPVFYLVRSDGVQSRFDTIDTFAGWYRLFWYYQPIERERHYQRSKKLQRVW